MGGRVAGTDKLDTPIPSGVAMCPDCFSSGFFYVLLEAKLKNRYVASGMALATQTKGAWPVARFPGRDSGGGLRYAQLTTAKAAIIAQAQKAVELAGLAEPDVDVVEHRQEGCRRGGTALHDRRDRTWESMFDSILAHAIPTGPPCRATAALRTTGESDPRLSIGDPGGDASPVGRGADSRSP